MSRSSSRRVGRIAFRILLVLPLLLIAAQARGGSTTVLVQADRDNTLYEDLAGTLSNGVGPHFFAGMNAVGQIRRGVFRFDVAAAVPAEAEIEAVRVVLTMDQTVVGEVFVGLHRLLADWGEGPSNATMMGGGGGATAENGDATWLHRFSPGDLWALAGGDFISTASAIRGVGDPATYTWESTAGLIADVEGWLADPGANFGWLVFADESLSPGAKRFASRENPDPASRPRLEVTFAGEPAAIPTLSGGSLALFALLLAALAAVLLRRRLAA